MTLALAVCAVLVSARPLAAQETAPAPVPAPEAEVATAPVELDGTVLLSVRGVSSLPPAERARLIQERLTEIAADPTVPAESVTTVDDENVSRIMAGDRLIMALTDADASLEQVSRTVLALVHARRFRS